MEVIKINRINLRRRTIAKRINLEKNTYSLIDEQHLKTHQLPSFVDISGLPEPQQADLYSIRALAGSQIAI